MLEFAYLKESPFLLHYRANLSSIIEVLRGKRELRKNLKVLALPTPPTPPYTG